MRIGIFTDTYPPYVNGVSTSIQMLEKGLKERGNEVFIVTVNPNGYRYECKNNIIRIPGVKTNIYDYRIAWTYSARAAMQIKKWNLDVIHTQTEFGIGTFARFIANELQLPLVHTYHTMYEDYKYYIFKGHFDKETDKGMEYFINYFCNSTPTELIVPTKKIYNLFRTRYHMTRDINIIPTGLEINHFYKENFNQDKINRLKKKFGLMGNVVTLFVGRLGDEKSVDKLIKAEPNILKSCPNHKLLIVGDGPDTNKYKDLVTKLNIEKNVVFTGKILYKNIPEYYQLADIFTTASKTETQGLTVVEAMAASLPVLAIQDDAFVDAINDSNGYLFKNMKDYTNKSVELINNPKLRIQLGKQARLDSNKFSVQTFASSVEKVYEKAIKEKDITNRSFINRAKNVVERGLHNE
jgi:1,2-diacylglycerol 3-alpha-glucosyltransferase